MGVGAYLSLSLKGREAGWGWALIRGWALIKFSFCLQEGRLFEVGANSRLGAYSNKYGILNAVTLNMCNCTLSLKFLVCSKDRAYSENRNQRMRQVVAFLGG